MDSQNQIADFRLALESLCDSPTDRRALVQILLEQAAAIASDMDDRPDALDAREAYELLSDLASAINPKECEDF